MILVSFPIPFYHLNKSHDIDVWVCFLLNLIQIFPIFFLKLITTLQNPLPFRSFLLTLVSNSTTLPFTSYIGISILLIFIMKNGKNLSQASLSITEIFLVTHPFPFSFV